MTEVNPGKIWGRRPYAGKEARELLNDVSRWIARTRPEGVEDPEDPGLAEILAYAGDALDNQRQTPKATTLAELMSDGLNYQEAVVWYWFRHCQYDITEIHYAINGNSTGGDPDQRRNATRNILAVLKSAATKIDGEDPTTVPDLIDERKRHDRSDHLTENDDSINDS